MQMREYQKSTAGMIAETMYRMCQNKLAVICMVIFLVIVLAVCGAGLIAPEGYDHPDISVRRSRRPAQSTGSGQTTMGGIFLPECCMAAESRCWWRSLRPRWRRC